MTKIILWLQLTKWLSWQHFLRDQNNFRSIIYSQNFTSFENSVKIVLVDVEVIVLTEIV